MDDDSRVYANNSFFVSLCMNREFDCATRLLEVECINVNWRDMMDETPLMTACERGNIDAVSFLLEKGADVNAKQYFHNCQGVTALLKAAAVGHTKIVKILLENGAEIDAKTGVGNTALMKARERGHAAVVRLIKNHMNRIILLVVEKGRTKDESPLVTHSHKDIAKHIASYLHAVVRPPKNLYDDFDEKYREYWLRKYGTRTLGNWCMRDRQRDRQEEEEEAAAELLEAQEAYEQEIEENAGKDISQLLAEDEEKRQAEREQYIW